MNWAIILAPSLTALHTGFRVSELLSLTWEDVDFRRRVMTVRAAYVKNGESRSVPMNEVLTATLQTVRMSTSTDGPVFRTRTGEPYRSFRTAFTHAVRQAGMVDFTFHDLRHTFASESVGHERRRFADGASFDGAQGHQHDTPVHAPLQRPQATGGLCPRVLCEKVPTIFPTEARAGDSDAV